MKVQDLMTNRVATVRPNDPTSAALHLMWDYDCGSLPVVDDNGRVVALVTDRDIAMTALFRDAAPSVLRVSDAMSRDLYACAPSDSVASAEETMRANQIRRLPVVDREGRLLGVLSLADIVRNAADRRRQDVIPEEFTTIFAHICLPRPPRGPAPSP